MDTLTALLQRVSLDTLSPVSLLVAFAGGVLSFISPCVLPLIPGYISFISGATLEQMRGQPPGGEQAGPSAASGATGAGRRVLLTSLAFVVGFSIVFVAFGATASALGHLLGSYKSKIAYVAGAILVILGLHTMGVFRIGFLDYEKRRQSSARPASLAGAALVGVAFAFGWTPCIGPILGGILTLAGAQESVAQGVVMLAVYSAGLGVPFLLTALALNSFFRAFARIRKHYHAIEVASGVLLIGIGVLMLANRLTVITNYLQAYLPKF
jgi:cytochrome c-type biogenesis protein